VSKCPPPPKKVEIKKQKKMGLSKIRKQFFNFNFFGGHFVTTTSFLFQNQCKKKSLNFSIPYMTYFKTKIFSSQKAQLKNSSAQKPKKDKNTTK
jgi:hypothetical protein